MPIGISEMLSLVADIITVGRSSRSLYWSRNAKRRNEKKIIKGITIEKDFIFINYVREPDDLISVSRFQKFDIKFDLEDYKILISDLFPHKEKRLVCKYCNIGEWQVRPGCKDIQIYCPRVRTGSLYFRTKMMFQCANHADVQQGYDGVQFEIKHNTKELIVFIRMHDRRCFAEQSIDSSVRRNSLDLNEGTKLYGSTIFSKDGSISKKIPNPPNELNPNIAEHTELVWIVNNLNIGDICQLSWNFFRCA